MHKYKIANGYYYSFAPEKGRNTDLFNRAAKIAREFKTIEAKLKGFVERGNGSLHAQMALGLLLTMHTGIRIGNESSAEGYMTKPHPHSKKKPEFVQTYGLTTLKWEHFSFRKMGKVCDVQFVGKKQVDNSFTVNNFLGKLLHNFYTLELEERLAHRGVVFQFSAYELTKFIKKYVGKQFSPKDFRTMRANYVASIAFKELLPTPVTKKSEVRAQVKQLCVNVSEHLNNTPGVCKKSYIDPRLLWEFEETLIDNIKK